MTGEKPVAKRSAAPRQRGTSGRFVAKPAAGAAKPAAASKPAASKPVASKPAAAAKQAVTKKPAVKKAAAKLAPAKKAAPKIGASKATGPKASAAKSTAESKAPATAPIAPSAPPVISTGQPAISAGIVLYLLRHADAGDPATWTGDDADRPLSKKGRRQARRLGKHLDALGLEVGPVIASPRLRAADTARLVGKAIGVKPGEDKSLGGGFDPTSLRRLLGGLASSATSVVLVGHDPDFSTLASWLTDAPVALRKGALARIDLPNREAAAGSGALTWLLPPDAIRG